MDPLIVAPPWLGDLVVQSTDAIAVIDETATVCWVNPAAARLFGAPADELVGRSVAEFVRADDAARAFATLSGVGLGAAPRPGLMHIRDVAGRWHLLEISASGIATTDADGRDRKLTMVAMRDNLLQEAHWNLLAAMSTDEPFAATLDAFARSMTNPTDGPMAIAFDEPGRRVVVGGVPAVLAGVADGGGCDDRPGTPWAEGVRSGAATWAPVSDLPDDVATVARTRGAAACVVAPVPDPASPRPLLLVQWPPVEAMGPVLVEALVRRPTQAMRLALERRDATRRLERLAHIDGLSGLATRERCFARLDELAAAGARYGLCYIDLDLFKEVNDSHGHQAGDAVIEACGLRLRGLCRTDDLAARLGGDEFALVCPGIDDERTLTSIAERVVQALAAPVAALERRISVGASVGCALAASDEPVDSVVARADAAMYAVKREGRSGWRLAPTR